MSDRTIYEIISKATMGAGICVIAGPCSVESEEQYRATATAVADVGAHMLRGGAFKPRTSPYSFQGLGIEGLDIMAGVARTVGLPLVTEAMDANDVDAVAERADVIQVGARNMENERLLIAVAATSKPVFLKRGMTATTDELLASADLLMDRGSGEVILCERGLRTNEPGLRNSLDFFGTAELATRTTLPVFIDPSHGTGRADLVSVMSRAAVAAGVDGLMLEVHPDPSSALSDGFQALDFDGFRALMASLLPLNSASPP
jgi:3-deoxy-7-phosphoheptulonate synthase